MKEDAYHQTRFEFDARRDVLWKTLCDAYFGKFVRPEFHTLELGAGYAHFINHVNCARRTAVDLWPMLEKYAAPGVDVHIGDITDLDFLEPGSVDFVFASNVFEHLTQADLAVVLAQLRKKMRKGGTLNILQPNYRLAYKEYFDDYTHVSIYSDVSLCDFLRANGYRILQSSPGFMPFSIKSRLPVFPWLIRLYLALPWKPFGKQMFIRARPEEL